MRGVPVNSVKVECNAKINLYLRVLGRREDGYHDIETIYHSISLHDDLLITTRDTGLRLSSSGSTVPRGMDNLAFRAAARVLDGTTLGAHVSIEKRIPAGAGLGGGSADAAGTLAGLNTLYGLGHSMKDLEVMAERLGADVKFMLRGGCAIGRGKGDELTPQPPLPALPVVLVIPPLSVSTAWAYGSLKMGLTSRETRLTMISNALGKGDVTSLCSLLQNDFEGLILDRYPPVGRIKQDLLGCGACGVLMSGSGPVVYGIFLKVGDATACKEELAGRGEDTVLARLAGSGVTVSR